MLISSHTYDWLEANCFRRLADCHLIFRHALWCLQHRRGQPSRYDSPRNYPVALGHTLTRKMDLLCSYLMDCKCQKLPIHCLCPERFSFRYEYRSSRYSFHPPEAALGTKWFLLFAASLLQLGFEVPPLLLLWSAAHILFWSFLRRSRFARRQLFPVTSPAFRFPRSSLPRLHRGAGPSSL